MSVARSSEIGGLDAVPFPPPPGHHPASKAGWGPPFMTFSDGGGFATLRRQLGPITTSGMVESNQVRGSIFGRLWALRGRLWAPHTGHSWSLAGNRGHAKALAISGFSQSFLCTPNGIRTRAATLKGWCPRPLDDGGQGETTLLRCGRAAGI